MLRSLRHLPVKQKLVVLTMAISGVAVLLACAAFAFYEQSQFRATMARDFAIIADMFDDNVAAGLEFNDAAAIERTLQTLGAHQYIIAACVYDKQGAVVGAYRRPGLAAGAALKFPHAQPTSQHFGPDRLDTFQDITLAGETIGVVYIGAELSELRERAWRYAAAVSILLAGCLLMAYVLASWLQHLISQPIEDLAQTVAVVAADKDYTVRAHKQGNDELGRLVDGFNEMLGQIQGRDADLKHARDQLEERVAERTGELQQENAERKRAEIGLANSLSLLNATLESTTDGIAAVDLAGRVISYNSKFAALWQFPPGLLARRDAAEMRAHTATQVKDAPAFLQLTHGLPEMPAAEQPGLIEHKDGRMFERYVFPQLIEGRSVGIVISWRDITERRKAEEALRRQQTELRVLFDLVPALIVFKDLKNVYRRVNQRFAAAAHLSVEEMEGKSSLEIFPNEAPRFNAEDAEVTRSGQPKLGTVELTHDPDGRALWVQTDKVPVAGPDGAVVGLVIMAQDITARVRTEESLRLLGSAVEQTKESIMITEAELNLPGPKIIFVNSAFTNMTGYAAAEVLGRNPRFMQGPRTDRAVLNRLRHNLEQGEEFIGEAINYRKDGTEYVQEWQIAPLRNVRGITTHFVAIQRDITERKQAEAALESANRERVDLSRQAGMAEVATGVLHNVGNVLNSVNVSATLVADTARRSKAGNLGKLSALLAEHSADLAAFLHSDRRGRMIQPYLASLAEELAREQQSMLTELDHLRKNVDHIKDIVAMQQNYAKTSGLIEVISIPELVEDAVRMNEGSLAKHDIAVAREYHARPVVALDKHKVLQILVNLIRNAKYACDESGRTDKHLTLRISLEERSVSIAVMDNGVGIPAANLTRIFNHGFTTRATGHGFGLHSGALAAKEMGGALVARSDGPGQGATFILTLPLKPEPPRP